ncbi:hypothetical protein ACQKKK_19485 [Peribacillus sp. NPDC006672]|uniref:hypothetical protein n=1 Tax=Peribacillus sp. NPDC006672 TaxID=3390606 RepID=UPI003CFFD02D
MNYLESFLLKVAVSVLLMVTTFEIWKSTDTNLLHWILPITALLWVIFTITEGVGILKANKWVQEKEAFDERAQRHNYQAGFYAFTVTIGALFVFFSAYSVLDNFLNPINAMAILGLLGTVVYFGTKTYLLFFD